MCSCDDIFKKIERLREKMEQVVQKKGLSSKEAIEISQKLDYLLNEYNRLKYKNNEK